MLLAADTPDVASELSTFTARHNHPDAFHIEIVVASHDELSDVDGIPRQRA